MTEPTPGPWQALPPQGRARLHGIFDADGGCLAECFGQKAAANARLIAAAPELLEAARAAVEYVARWAEGHPGDFASYAAMNALDSAIAKATSHD